LYVFIDKIKKPLKVPTVNRDERFISRGATLLHRESFKKYFPDPLYPYNFRYL